MGWLDRGNGVAAVEVMGRPDSGVAAEGAQPSKKAK